MAHFSPLSPFFQTAAITAAAIPLSVLAQVDNRIASALRGVDPRAERDPPLALALLAAAVRECEGVHLTEDGLGVSDLSLQLTSKRHSVDHCSRLFDQEECALEKLHVILSLIACMRSCHPSFAFQLKAA